MAKPENSTPSAPASQDGTLESWTILKVIQWTTGYFTRNSVEQPRGNAEVLIAHALGLDRLQLYLRYDQPLTPEELARCRALIRRRAAREPAQYITGKQEFRSLEFEVTPAVLIPRPETELLVEKAVELLGGRENPLILDVGTGSGAIAVALAHELPDVGVFAIDRSTRALEVARRNAARHGVLHRIRFAAMDLFGGISPADPVFDVVVSNPPYIGETEFGTLAPEVARFEPASALRGGGPEGLAIVRRLVREVLPFLRPGGDLLIEIGMGQAELLEPEAAGNPNFSSFEFLKDYAGIRRILHLVKVGSPNP